MWEYIWMGDIPVAQIVNNGGSVTVYYIHTDQLNAPRKITLPSTNALAWRWDPHPFAEATPNQNPSSLGTFINNLRFPGQYYTAGSGLNHNGFRDYDPQTGRYIESDPAGLGGGLNTYAYARENPIMRGDPSGLFSLQIMDTLMHVDTIPKHPDSLGFTDFNVTTLCACTCGSASKLIGCTSSVNILVYIKNGFSASKDAWVVHGESQHSTDLADASGTYRKAGQAIEDDIKRLKSFPSQKDCEQRSQKAVGKYVAEAVATVYGQTIHRYDDSGEHYWYPWSTW